MDVVDGVGLYGSTVPGQTVKTREVGDEAFDAQLEGFVENKSDGTFFGGIIGKEDDGARKGW